MAKNLVSSIRKAFIGLTLGAVAGLIACQPIEGKAPILLTPPLPIVYEGTIYECLVQFSGGENYSITVVPKTLSAPLWDNFTVSSQGSKGVYIKSGIAPQVPESMEYKYDAKLLASNSSGTTEIDYVITDLDVKAPSPLPN